MWRHLKEFLCTTRKVKQKNDWNWIYSICSAGHRRSRRHRLHRLARTCLLPPTTVNTYTLQQWRSHTRKWRRHKDVTLAVAHGHHPEGTMPSSWRKKDGCVCAADAFLFLCRLRQKQFALISFSKGRLFLPILIEWPIKCRFVKGWNVYKNRQNPVKTEKYYDKIAKKWAKYQQ